jgi:hypothetical protein
VPELYDYGKRIYYNADDPLDCFGSYHMALQTLDLRQMPCILGALEEAGIPSIAPSLTNNVFYPARAAHLYPHGGPDEISFTVLALDPDDREFKIKFDSNKLMNVEDLNVAVFLPDGKLGQVIEMPRAKISRGQKTGYVTIPKDGQNGVYVLKVYGQYPSLAEPLTDLPCEAMLLPKGKEVRAAQQLAGYLALPPNSSMTLKLTGKPWGLAIPDVNYVVIKDERSKTLLDTSLLHIAKRRSTTLELKSGAKTGSWRFYSYGWNGPGLSWTGDGAGLFLTRTPNDLKPILDALPPSFFAPPPRLH